MTATDQAFIRAYQQPAEEPAQETKQRTRTQNDGAGAVQRWMPSVHYASPFLQSTAESSVSDNAQDDAPDNASGYASGYAAEQTQTHHRIDQKVDQKIDSKITENATHSESAPESPGTQSPRTQSTKQTLASIVASRQQPKNHGEPETTVASFCLPSICRKLLSNHADAYQQVVSSLLADLNEGRTVIGVAHCQTGTGCTTNLLCLASRFLAQGKSVVLIDANFAKPDLANLLGLSPTTTWQDVLQAGAPIEEALIRSAAEGLTVLPSANAPTESLSETARLQASVTAGALRYEFDVALVDLGVIGPEASHQTAGLELAQAMRIDGVLLVVDPTRDDFVQQNNTQRLLEQHGCKTLGTIEVGTVESVS